MSGLYEVRHLDVPLTVNHPAAVRHAQRVADLTQAYTAALARMTGQDQRAYADLLAVGIGLSWWLDLQLVGGSTGLWADVAHLVWPGQPGWVARLKEAVAADAPRYEPGWSPARCPVRGSRGGVCHERGARLDRWVTDVASGEWERRDVCDQHRPEAAQRRTEAPAPRPNRGGVLAEVFPELEMAEQYRQFRKGWEPPGYVPPTVVVPAKREFRLVLGDAS